MKRANQFIGAILPFESSLSDCTRLWSCPYHALTAWGVPTQRINIWPIIKGVVCVCTHTSSHRSPSGRMIPSLPSEKNFCLHAQNVLCPGLGTFVPMRTKSLIVETKCS